MPDEERKGLAPNEDQPPPEHRANGYEQSNAQADWNPIDSPRVSRGGGLADPAMQRRAEAAVRSPRLESGRDDPDSPLTRFHKPATGLVATGYLFGFARGGLDAIDRVMHLIPPDARPEAQAIAADYSEDDEAP